jgi:hypothetical protein
MGKQRDKEGQGPNYGAKSLDLGSPIIPPFRIFSSHQESICDLLQALTVVNILEIVIKHRYPPTIATAGLSFSHHHTHVVENHTPEMPSTSSDEATNAHGESPPVSSHPLQKNRFRDGCCW